MIHPKLSIIALGVVLCLTSSCNRNAGPERHSLSGKIHYDGSPIASGTISFSPDADAGNTGPGSTAEIQDGHYQTRNAKGVVGGPYIAVVTAFSAPNVPLFPPYELKISVPEQGGTVDIEVPKLKVPQPTATQAKPTAPPERAD